MRAIIAATAHARYIGEMPITRYILTVLERWQSGWKDILVAAIAGGLAWFVAEWFFSDKFQSHQPIFAAIAAIASLAPGAPNHGKQAMALLCGVTTGVLLGELALSLPEWPLAIRIVCVTAMGLGAGAVFGTVPMIGMQAATSALLVILLGFSVAGTTRLYDVIIGAGIGLLFSQVLLTPDPVRTLNRAAQKLLKMLGDGLDASAAALNSADAKKAQAALTTVTQAHASLNTLEVGIANARFSARWSLRGRLSADAVAAMAERYDRRAIRVYASALMLAEGIANGLNREGAPPPDWLAARVGALALLTKAGSGDALAEPASVAEGRWLAVCHYLAEFEEALREFNRSAATAVRVMEAAKEKPEPVPMPAPPPEPPPMAP